jgi:O-antigen/teichoic acid export membrane protein
LIVRGLASVLALGAGMLLTGSLVWGVTGLAAAWAGVLLLHDIRLPASRERSPWRAPRDFSAVSRLVLLTLPLGLVMLMLSLNTNVPRYFIERQLGTEALGIFAAVAYLAAAGSLVMDSLGQSAIPRLARYFAAGHLRAFFRLVGGMAGTGLLVGIAGIAVAWLAGTELLAFMYRPEHATRVDVLLWLVVAAAINCVVSALGHALVAARLFRVQPAILGGALLWTVIASYYLIPAYGLMGAAWTTIVSYVIQLAGCLGCLLWVWRSRTLAAPALVLSPPTPLAGRVSH